MYIEQPGDDKALIILDRGQSVTVELPGGNGQTITVSDESDGFSVKDEDGFDLTSAYWKE